MVPEQALHRAPLMGKPVSQQCFASGPGDHLISLILDTQSLASERIELITWYLCSLLAARWISRASKGSCALRVSALVVVGYL